MRRQSICTTLTYAPEHLPLHGSLCKPHAQKFIRALRQLVARRFKALGLPVPLFSFDLYAEYSPERKRPHYHAALFGYEPPDWKRYAKSGAGNQEFTSDELTRAWGKGLVTFQNWSHGAASYCAGHQAWKVTGSKSRQDLQVLADGVVVGERAPEFRLVSTRPAIGLSYFQKHGEQALALNECAIKGKLVPVPKYYLRKGKVAFPELAEAAIAERRDVALAKSDELTDARREVIEVCNQALIRRSSRKNGL